MSPIELTDSELEYLRANYGRITNREIAEHLYIGPTSVSRLVRRYRIRPATQTAKKGNGKKGSRWTPDDNQRLLSMIDAGHTYAEIAAALHRTVSSVVTYKSLHYRDYPSPPHQSSIHRGKKP